MAIKSSAELQSIVLSTIIKDTYIMTRTIKYIDEEFFNKYSYKVIFKSLKYYYNKYSKIPSLSELMVILEDFHRPEFGNLDELKQECQSLYDTPRYDENFVIDKLTTFIKRNNVEKTLKELLPKVNEGSEIAVESIGEQLASSLSFQIGKTNSFNLSNTSELGAIRRAAIGSEDNPLIIKSCIDPINSCLQFKGYKPGDVIMICSPPGVGKTMFMINEGANAAIQGFNVLHLFLGDMKEYDGFIRYTSCLTGRLQDDIVAMSLDDQAELIRHYNFQGTFNRITVAAYAAGEIDSKEMIQEVKRLQDENHMHYDLINIDYADNLAESSDNMYKNGGDIYNDISLLAGTNHSVVIVGSQPKTEFWDEEIIPKKGAAESAKKQHIIDVMITMNKFNKTANIGSIFLPKVRRGQEGKIIRWMSHYEKAKLEVIKEDEYLKEKATY